jgi:hypothetical protein
VSWGSVQSSDKAGCTCHSERPSATGACELDVVCVEFAFVFHVVVVFAVVAVLECVEGGVGGE